MQGITDIHHVIYGHPDLDAGERFFRDFGMVTAERGEQSLYLRGTGPASYLYVAQRAPRPGFIAVALAVDSAETLRRFAAMPGASGPSPLAGPRRRSARLAARPRRFPHRPGARHRAGCAAADAPGADHQHRPDKPRRGAVQRPEKAAAQIARLGHVALFVSNFAAAASGTSRPWGYLPPMSCTTASRTRPWAAFCAATVGEEWVDHHTVALFESPSVHIHHSSYEVQDLDMLMMGHEWLRAAESQPLWGVGRHVLGSQIFDYWWDPAGHLVEHFSDGDLLQARHQTGFTPNTADALCQWGPPLPEAFFA